MTVFVDRHIGRLFLHQLSYNYRVLL